MTSLHPKKADAARLLGLNRGNRFRVMAGLRNAAIRLLRLAGATNIAASTREPGRHRETIALLIRL